MLSDPLSCSPPQSQQCQVQRADVGQCSPILTTFSMNWQEHNPNSPPHLTKSMERAADNKDGLAKDNKEKNYSIIEYSELEENHRIKSNSCCSLFINPTTDPSEAGERGSVIRTVTKGPAKMKGFGHPLFILFLLITGMKRNDPW